jgi:hypothetical protein
MGADQVVHCRRSGWPTFHDCRSASLWRNLNLPVPAWAYPRVALSSWLQGDLSAGLLSVPLKPMVTRLKTCGLSNAISQ